MNHSPEPWIVEATLLFSGEIDSPRTNVLADFSAVSPVSIYECEDNAQRAAECVNALAGVDFEALTEEQRIALAVLKGEPVEGLLDKLLEQHGGEFPGKAQLEANVRELEMRITHLQLQLANALSALTRQVTSPPEDQPDVWLRPTSRQPPTITFSDRTKERHG